MDERPKSNPALLWISLICGVLLAGFLISPFGGIRLAVWKIKRDEKKLQRPELYNSVATNLALYTQTFRPFFVPGFTDVGLLGAKDLPQPMDQLSISYASIRSDGASLEFGGGFYHYGFALAKEENSFVLRFYSEGQRDAKKLVELNLAFDAKLPITAFDSRIISDLDAAITNSPNEIGPTQYKIIFLLIYDRAAARVATEKAAVDFPEHWWPQMMLAILDANGNARDESHARYKQWVEEHPHFVHYFFLAFYQDAIGLTDDAGASIEKAASQGISSLRGDVWSVEARAKAAARFALKLKKYAAALTLGKRLASKQSKDFADNELSAIINAAEALNAGQDEKSVLSEIDLNPMDISAYLEKPYSTQRPSTSPILLPMKR